LESSRLTGGPPGSAPKRQEGKYDLSREKKKSDQASCSTKFALLGRKRKMPGVCTATLARQAGQKKKGGKKALSLAIIGKGEFN